MPRRPAPVPGLREPTDRQHPPSYVPKHERHQFDAAAPVLMPATVKVTVYQRPSPSGAQGRGIDRMADPIPMPKGTVGTFGPVMRPGANDFRAVPSRRHGEQRVLCYASTTDTTTKE